MSGLAIVESLLRYADLLAALLVAGSLVLAGWELRLLRRQAEDGFSAQQLEGYRHLYAEYVDRPVGGPDGPSWESTRRDSIQQWQLAREQGRAYEVPEHVGREAANRLQRLGLAVFYGAIPLRIVLADVSGRITADWVLCQPWLEKFRAGSSLHPPMVPKREVHYARRHGEWLAYVAAVWLATRWSVNTAVATLGASDAVIKSKIDEIAKLDGQPPGVRREVTAIWREYERAQGSKHPDLPGGPRAST